MPEGPSIVILKEQVQNFAGRKVLEVRVSRIAHPLTPIHILELTGNMTSSQIDALASPMKATMHAEEVPRPSAIKIRFKKSTIFAKPADGGTATAAMSSQLPIRLSPGSEKRKAAEDMGFKMGAACCK